MDEVAAVSEGRLELGRPAVVLLCGSLVYYHCAYRDSSLLSLFSDVLIVLLCSLAILGMLFRQMNISCGLIETLIYLCFFDLHLLSCFNYTLEFG
ncbi:hypothetical protein M5K25_024672 [Dendrobium thyrsiflorum]|uniref:Uncharacterized protein n=1 Tax=Dendrobium thyrsiflorum TaxID=117978 RepID=A0ABD0U2W3_DENTH